jgi:aromatic-L-amino-acid decarboxylase
MFEKESFVAGDMDLEEFREYGHRMVDWIAEYLAHPDRYPVLSKVKPGDVKRMLGAAPPEAGESMEDIFEDLERIVLPGITHWNHPAFFAYFSITGSGPGILAEFLSAALNVNAMLWKTSPAATELEEVSLAWLRQMLGLPDSFWGIIYDTASTSTLHAVVAAREAIPGYNVREEGLTTAPRLRLYASEQAHSSVDKAAITSGLGQSAVCRIPVDEVFRMDPRALGEAVEKDVRDGRLPFCVIATVGTTSTTSVDPVQEIAEVCSKHGLWLHVDAAYGGTTALLPEMKGVLDGCEQADSLVVNPHKWLFTPIDLSAFFCRRPDVLKQAFSLVPEYLQTTADDTVTNYMDYGFQLGRRFRALKLWMVIRFFGRAGLVERIRQHLAWAQEFALWVDADPDFERMAPTPFSTVCFRAHPAHSLQNGDPVSWLNKLNSRLLDLVNQTGEAFLSHTKLRDQFTLRLAVGNLKTRREHLLRTWEILKEKTELLKTQAL